MTIARNALQCMRSMPPVPVLPRTLMIRPSNNALMIQPPKTSSNLNKKDYSSSTILAAFENIERQENLLANCAIRSPFIQLKMLSSNVKLQEEQLLDLKKSIAGHEQRIKELNSLGELIKARSNFLDEEIKSLNRSIKCAQIATLVALTAAIFWPK